VLEIIASKIKLVTTHGMHVYIGDTELADLGFELREQVIGRIDSGNAAFRTNLLRRLLSQCSGAGSDIQDFIARCGAQVHQQSIGTEDREPQGLAIHSCNH
jgi:hypothetical protein